MGNSSSSATLSSVKITSMRIEYRSRKVLNSPSLLNYFTVEFHAKFPIVEISNNIFMTSSMIQIGKLLKYSRS